MQLHPYPYFEGRCEDAIQFYKTALGAQVDTLMRFKEGPSHSSVPAGSGEKVMRAAFRIANTTVMASDGRCAGAPNFQLALTVSDVADSDRLFSALADGGRVQMPLAETFFSARYGTIADRFGVDWMVVVAPRI